MSNKLKLYLESLPTLKDLILDVIPAYDLYCELTGEELKVGGSKLIKSPLRTDSLPTFGLFMHHTDDVVMFKDFAYAVGDVFLFIKLFALYNDNIRIKSLYDTATYINYKLGIDVFNTDNSSRKEIKRREFDKITSRDIRFISRAYTKKDLAYFIQYGITEAILRYYDIRSVYKLLDDENRILRQFGSDELCFAFVIFNKIKLYQPLESSGFKWRNTCPAWYIQGWKQRRKKSKLIITKSMKDIMTFFALLGKQYDIIAPHSENYNFTDKIVDIINRDYSEVIVIYDFDRAGVNGANKLKRKYGWRVEFVSTKRVFINGRLKVIDKDISDLVYNKGITQGKLACKKMNL